MSEIELALPRIQRQSWLKTGAEQPPVPSCCIEVPASQQLMPKAQQCASVIQRLLLDGAPVGFELWLTSTGPRYVVRVPVQSKRFAQAAIAASTGTDILDAAPLPVNALPDWQVIGRPRRAEYRPFGGLADAMQQHNEADPLEAFMSVCPLLEVGDGVVYQMLVKRADRARLAQYERLAISRQAEDAATALSMKQQAGYWGYWLAIGIGALFPAVVLGTHLGFEAFAVSYLATGGGGGYWLFRRQKAQWFGGLDGAVDSALVQRKLAFPACDVELRVSVYAPDKPEITQSIEAAIAGLERRADGNGFELVEANFNMADLRFVGKSVWMNVDEVAAYWHQFSSTAFRTNFTWRAPQPNVLPANGFIMGKVGRPPTLQPARMSLRKLLDTPMLVLGGRDSGKTNMRRVWLQGSIHELSEQLDDPLPPAILNLDPLSGEGWLDFGRYPASMAHRLHILSTSDKVAPGYSLAFNPFEVRSLEEGVQRWWSLRNAWRYYFEALGAGSWGPRMQHLLLIVFGPPIMANARMAIDPDGPRPPKYTLLDALAMMRNLEYWKLVLHEARSRELEDAFAKWFLRYPDKDQLETISPLMQKLAEIQITPHLRRMFGTAKSTFNLMDMFDRGDIVTLHCPESEFQYEPNRVFLATMLNIVLDGLIGRTRLPPNQRRPLLMLIDEAHLVPMDFDKAFSVTRQMGASQILMDQTVSHFVLPENAMGGISANLKGVICMRMAGELDEKFAARWLEDIAPIETLKDMPLGAAYCKLYGAPPFSLQFDASASDTDPEAAKAARALIERDIEAGFYRSIEDIDAEYEAREKAWESIPAPRRRSRETLGNERHGQRAQPVDNARTETSGQARAMRARTVANATFADGYHPYEGPQPGAGTSLAGETAPGFNVDLQNAGD